MNYNRRGGPPLASVGQRRPQTTNFVSGGQLNRPGFQQQQQQQQQKPQTSSVSNRLQQIKANHQQAQQQQFQPQQFQQQTPQQQPQPQNDAPQSQVPKTMQEIAQQKIAQLAAPQPPKIEAQTMDVSDTEQAANGEQKQKPFWMKKPAGKISKAERIKRRNFRLKKVLQPKNALMVLNELIGSTNYTVTESKTGYNHDLFDAALSYDGEQFVGTGKSKVAAKTAAAEKAIKYIIIKKINSKAAAPSTPMEEDVKTEQEKQEEDLSWSHIASFAMHKLFSSWDEDGKLAENFANDSTSNVDGPLSRTSSLASLQAVEQKPAKKLPENAAQLNPVMLLNQMYPNAKYEEVARVGQPPNVQFTISCTVNGQVFTGTGQNKKTARKKAALVVCRTILKVEYPPEILNEAMQPPIY